MSIDHHPTWDVPQENEVKRSTIFIARCKYDFAVDGGGQGAITLFPDVAIPSGSLILGAYLDVQIAPVGVGATLALHINAADDIDADGAIDSAPWSTTGRKACDLALGSDPVELTADRNVTLTISTTDLTAGVFEVLIMYLPPGM